MRYNQHCVLLLITLIILMFHLQQVSIFSGTISEDEIFRTGRKVLLKDRINSRQFRTRTNALRKVVDVIAGRQPNFNTQKERPSSIKTSNTLVYNRIDKAGSTTLISMFRKFRTKFELSLCFKRLWRKFLTKTPSTLLVREIQMSGSLILARKKIWLTFSAEKTIISFTQDTSIIQTSLSQAVM